MAVSALHWAVRCSSLLGIYAVIHYRPNLDVTFGYCQFRNLVSICLEKEQYVIPLCNRNVLLRIKYVGVDAQPAALCSHF